MKQESPQFLKAESVLYGQQTERCLENLSCSSFKFSHYPQLIRALALVKKAAALANQAACVLDEQTCSRICIACDEILEHRHDLQFPVDMLHGGGSIAFNQNMNEVVATIASRAQFGDAMVIDAKKHVNASQSTADSCSTAFRLALLDAAGPLVEVLESICELLLSKENENAQTITVARTCLQDAMTVSISSAFAGWRCAVARRSQRIKCNLEQLHSVNIGGTVIGSGEGAPEEYRRCVLPILAQLSNLSLNHRDNLYDAAQNCDDIAELSSSLSLLAEVLIKVCSDLRLLSSGPRFGFGELSLPAVQDGSSFFLNKNNPVVPETVLQACFHVLGNHRSVTAALEHAELNLNIFESGAFFHTLDSIIVLHSSLRLLLKKCLQDIIVNTEKCAAMVQQHRSL